METLQLADRRDDDGTHVVNTLFQPLMTKWMELSFRTSSKRIGVSGAFTRVSSVFGSFSTVSVRDKPVENRLAKQLPQQLVRYAKLERNNLFSMKRIFVELT